MPKQDVGGNGCGGVKLGGPARKRILTVLVFVFVWGGALFVSAGRWDWTRGWIYFGATLLTTGVSGVATLRKNPELIAARGSLHRKEMRTFDKVIMALYVPTSFVIPVVAGLDAVRFGWAPLPWKTLYAGLLLQLLSWAPIAWAMAVNPFLETTVRIQSERGHRVVSTGPYRVVRHPMYVGAILTFAAGPLVLGSLWAYAPAGFAAVLFLFRTGLEDRTLRRELAGYEEYAQRTRYRLLPGVW